MRELLAGQDPAAWPAYGRLLGVRGFADEVRQLLTRMQESLLSPKELAETADKAGLGGWAELARFAQEYLDALDTTGELPRTVLYNLNPADNYAFATMIGNFQDGSVAGAVACRSRIPRST